MSVAQSPRIIFIGDSGVGKTALIHRSKSNRFNEHTTPTIGAGITEMEAQVDGQRIGFQFWDTAGQEIYRNIVPIYFKGVSGAVLVFSMTERQSFVSLDTWVGQLASHADDGVGVLVCGNKIDLQERKVDRLEAEQWANEKQFTIIFTSAKTGENIDVLIDHIPANSSHRPGSSHCQSQSASRTRSKQRYAADTR
jgi:small GTP-binding protein